MNIRNKKDKRILIFGLLSVLLLLGGFAAGFYFEKALTNPKAVIPRSLKQPTKVFIEEDMYHSWDLTAFINKGSDKTKVSIEGVVTAVRAQPDGDIHVILSDPKSSFLLVTEIIPQIPLPLPQVGDKVRLRGITRFDFIHNWWEIHPVIGWQKI